MKGRRDTISLGEGSALKTSLIARDQVLKETIGAKEVENTARWAAPTRRIATGVAGSKQLLGKNKRKQGGG